MKAVKIVLISALVYVGIVVLFESLLGYFQPANQSTLVITTTDQDGLTHDRVLSSLDSGGHLYIAVNHWPRAWYGHVQENPNVQISMAGEKGDYLAVEVSGQEYDRVNAEHDLGIVIRVLTGFPPRYILRIDPRT